MEDGGGFNINSALSYGAFSQFSMGAPATNHKQQGRPDKPQSSAQHLLTWELARKSAMSALQAKDPYVDGQYNALPRLCLGSYNRHSILEHSFSRILKTSEKAWQATTEPNREETEPGLELGVAKQAFTTKVASAGSSAPQAESPTSVDSVKLGRNLAKKTLLSTHICKREVADSSTGVIFTYLVRAHYSQRQPLLAGDQQCFVAALKLLVK
ncbi:MAG: hypothetical protein FRX49_01912 [Trebouxia sp. A1-2]|nr:MAG: hypothetical protein FRX49_01912 [Trebouxia sp. A1-2]